jgi:hypothetical protein
MYSKLIANNFKYIGFEDIAAVVMEAYVFCDGLGNREYGRGDPSR